VKGTIHWVSVAHAVRAQVRLYDRLFASENPAADEKELDSEEGDAFLSLLNPNSLQTVRALVEPNLAGRAVGDRVQFMRKGYFCVDADSTETELVFNRIVTLKDTWAKVAAK
jgi:glutaminyl-tRNA synthetase